MADPVIIFLTVAIGIIFLALFIGWLTNRKNTGESSKTKSDISGNEARLLGLLALLGKSGKK